MRVGEKRDKTLKHNHKSATSSFPSRKPPSLTMSLCWKIPFFLGRLMFTDQEKQVHHHQHLNYGAPRWWNRRHPRPHSNEKLSSWNTNNLIRMKWRTNDKYLKEWRRNDKYVQVLLATIWCRLVSLKVYFSFSHYFIENVTSWAGRESESEHFISGETHRKLHLQLQQGSRIKSPQKPLSF